MVAVRRENSTNVRSDDWRLRAVRAGLRAVESQSPDLAAAIGEKIMFRTTRRPARDWEESILARGTRFRVHSSGGRLEAWRWGEGPAVVLVHGWNGRGSQLGAFVDPLVSAGFQVVTFDAPGHGRSNGSSSSLVEFADAFDAVLDAVRPAFERVRGVIAHSMGGAAVTLAMSRIARAPISTFERPVRDAGLPVERFVFIAPPIDVRDFVRTFTRTVGLGEATRDSLSRRIESKFAVRLEDMYAPKLARELSAPLLVVHDEDDREVPLRCGRMLAESWPSAELAVTSGLGHTRILRETSVIERIRSFVDR